MKKLYGYLAIVSFIISLMVGLTLPARAARPPIMQRFYQLFDKQVEEVQIEKGNRLLVITESWCLPCRLLHPHLEQLKKEGYTIYTYTKIEWERVKGKPSNLPKTLLPNRWGQTKYSIPMVLYVRSTVTPIDGDVTHEYKVVRTHYGGKDKNVKYIKKYLTK